MTSGDSDHDRSPIGLTRPEQGQVSPLTPQQQKALASRRRFLQVTAGGSLAAIAAAFAFPVLAIKSLTQFPDVIAAGDVVADASGTNPVDVGSFAINTAIWARPIYKPDTDQFNQVELVRVAQNGDAQDFRAYSRICTHIGCSVLPTLSPEGHIRCPCHGSQFDISTGHVVQGPAVKTLPNIALALNGQGQLIFDSDEYSAPIGPGN